MEESRKQEIEKLLVDSLENIQVTNRIDPNINKQTYISLFAKNSRQFFQNPTLYKVTSELSINDLTIKKKLLDFVRVELSEYIRDDKIKSCISVIRGGAAIYSLEDILESLWRISLVWDVNHAVHVFEMTIEKKRIFYKNLTMIDGLKVEHEMQISPGITLVPSPDSTGIFPSYLPDPFIGVSKWDLTYKTLAVIEHTVSPALAKPPKSDTFFEGFRATQINQEIPNLNINTLCNMFALIANIAVRPFIWSVYISDDELLVYEGGGFGCARTSGDKPRDMYSVSVSNIQINEAKNLYSMYINLSPEVREKLDVAIPRWIKSKESRGSVDTMIDLGIAFESLFLDKNTKEQLSFTFRFHAACYLGESKDDRKELLAEFKAIYNCRSTAIHTGKLDNEIKVGNKKVLVHEFFKKSQDLCLKSIMKVITDGKFPDWDELILG